MQNPGLTLGGVLDRVGSTLLSVYGEPAGLQRPVTSVLLYDPLDLPRVIPGALVLGVGLQTPSNVAQVVGSLGRDGAVALVVREPIASIAAIDEALAANSILLLGLTKGASWVQVANLVSSALTAAASGGPPFQEKVVDLFELANALASLLDAPVTIEDRSSRVIAFSADQSAADPERHRTILGMHVPSELNEVIREHGVFQRVYEAEHPVYMTGVVEGAMPRVAMRLQVGDECLGAVWAVVRQPPLSPQREQGLVEAARLIAIAMMRARFDADATARARVQSIISLLEGGPGAREAARGLDIADQSLCVIAIGESSAVSDDGSREAEDQRTANALGTFLRATAPQSIAARVGSTLYAVLPTDRADDAVRLASSFIERLASARPYCAGVGDMVRDASELAYARAGAEAALRVLTTTPRSGRRVAAFGEVHVEHLIDRMGEIMMSERTPRGPVDALLDYDREHSASMVSTLRAWLDAFGDASMAADAVHVHKNTLRYRLSRIEKIGEVDLSKPEVRFALSLQLRVLDRSNLSS